MKNILKQKALCRITDTATKKLQELLKNTSKESLAKGDQNHFFPRLSVIQSGCSGLSYKLCFIPSQQKQVSDVLVPTADPSFHLLIDKKSVLYLAGVEIDYKETDIESQFLFKNSNQKTSCGCAYLLKRLKKNFVLTKKKKKTIMSQINLYTQECASISDDFSEDLQCIKKKIHYDNSELLVSTPSRSTPKMKKNGIRWDDKIIEEHNQLRGTRMRIKEPKTPFCRDLYCDSMEHDSSDSLASSNPFDNPPCEYNASTPANVSSNKYSFYTQFLTNDSSQDSQCFESSDASSNEILLSATNQVYFKECPLVQGYKSSISSRDNL